jgi:hypothetical protein
VVAVSFSLQPDGCRQDGLVPLQDLQQANHGEREVSVHRRKAVLESPEGGPGVALFPKFWMGLVSMQDLTKDLKQANHGKREIISLYHSSCKSGGEGGN